MKNTSKVDKNSKKRLHFIGIGGVSMSALAKLVSSQFIVTGTDDVDSKTLDTLNLYKIKTTVGTAPEMVRQADIVVYTTAVGEHPDLKLARSLKKTIYERAEFLGEVSRRFRHTIAISGTHGKTTTTAMLGEIFECASFAPTVHLGGISNKWNSNLRKGGAEYFITEACEYNRSFLNLSPECSCITNIECDHMDTYRDLEDIRSTFCKFAKKTKKTIVYCGDCVDLPTFKSKQYFSYGFDEKNRFCAKNLHQKNGAFQFDCYLDNKFYLRAKLKVLGKHNVLNALGCIAICYAYHIPYIYIIEGLQNFDGVARRQTFLGETAGTKHYGDYAHHPTEIKATLSAFSQLAPKGRIITIFQPHTYSRTLALKNEFVKALYNCRELILLPTFSARENYIEGGDSTDLFFELTQSEIKRVATHKGKNSHSSCQKLKITYNRTYCTNYASLEFTLDNLLEPNDICLWLGAGDIYQIAKMYIQRAGHNKMQGDE